MRKSIKDLITATLGASTPLARAAAAQVIAKVGAIEIQPGNNEWPELLGGLFGVISRVDLPEGPRASALTALGYLLEELDAYTDSPLSQPEVDCALTTICACVHVPAGAPPLPLHIQRAAVEALYNTLPFVAANFANDRANERDSIMFAICSATQCPDTKVRESAFQCIERIAELYYDYVGPYMKVLADLTAAAAKGADENVATHALGFWSEVRGRKRWQLKGGGGVLLPSARHPPTHTSPPTPTPCRSLKQRRSARRAPLRSQTTATLRRRLHPSCRCSQTSCAP